MSLCLGAAARAQSMFIVYCDSGIAWRVGEHDHEFERARIEQNYAIDVQNAKDRYSNAVNAINSSGISGGEYTDEMNYANQQLQNDLQAATDRRIASYDAIYPHRWDEFGNYPEFVLVGYSGPCHFCSLYLSGGTISWFSFLLPYPGYNKPCLFGWHWGDHHGFREIQPARAAFRANTERRLGVKSRNAVDLAFHNANRFVQTRHRSDLGRTQNDDVKFLSDHHVPPARNSNVGHIVRDANNNPPRRTTGNSSSRGNSGNSNSRGSSRGSSGGSSGGNRGGSSGGGSRGGGGGGRDKGH